MANYLNPSLNLDLTIADWSKIVKTMIMNVQYLGNCISNGETLIAICFRNLFLKQLKHGHISINCRQHQIELALIYIEKKYFHNLLQETFES